MFLVGQISQPALLVSLKHSQRPDESSQTCIRRVLKLPKPDAMKIVGLPRSEGIRWMCREDRPRPSAALCVRWAEGL